MTAGEFQIGSTWMWIGCLFGSLDLSGSWDLYVVIGATGGWVDCARLIFDGREVLESAKFHCDGGYARESQRLA